MKKKPEKADPEFTAKHGSCEQQWARQPGTITSRAASLALVSSVNLAWGASQHTPWVPDCLCGRQTSPLSPQYRPRLAMPAPSKAEARHRAEQTRGSGPSVSGISIYICFGIFFTGNNNNGIIAVCLHVGVSEVSEGWWLNLVSLVVGCSTGCPLLSA